MLENLIARKFNRVSLVLALPFVLAGCYASTNVGNEPQLYQPDPESIAAGRALYEQYCLECHGAGLRGDGPAADSLDRKPADLNQKSLHYTQTAIKGVIDYPHYSREAITDRIKSGNSEMPPLKDVLNRQEISALADYISTAIRDVD